MNSLIPTDSEMKSISLMSQNAKNSKFFEKLGGESGIFCIMLAARELGVPLMQALCGGIRNIQGNIEVAPRLMNSMIRRAGHQIHILECNEKICVLKGIRKDTGEIYECSYGIEDAARAGISGKDNYKKHPSDMLFARCMSILGRRLFADVIGIAYVEGEIPQAPREMEPPEEEIMISTAQVQKVQKLIEGWEEETQQKFLEYMGLAALSEMKTSQYPKALASIKKKIEKDSKVVEVINESTEVA